MKDIKCKLDNKIILEAYGFEELRDSCKLYLKKTHNDFDKFTVVAHDSFIGYISESMVKEYIEKHYGKDGVVVQSWDEDFDFARIRNIVKKDLRDERSISYVRNYFYDKWDLKIIYKDVVMRVDVKTALTMKKPTSYWNFLYPVIQVDKEGKDAMVLAYYIVDDLKCVETLNELVIAGFTTKKLIERCKIVEKGSRTRFGTLSQIDNYETELSNDYKSLDRLIGYILNKR